MNCSVCDTKLVPIIDLDLGAVWLCPERLELYHQVLEKADKEGDKKMNCSVCNAVLVYADIGRRMDWVCPARVAHWHQIKEKEMYAKNTLQGEIMKDTDKADWDKASQPMAIRSSVDYRYDILYAPFMHMMAQIASVGAAKYGDYNWHKSRLTGEKSPVNHIYDHMTKYSVKTPYDHLEIGNHYKIHLASVAFNAMMEFWYADNMDNRAQQNYGELNISLQNPGAKTATEARREPNPEKEQG